MTTEIIDVGDLPNDGTGDPLRVAFEKINNNFSELMSLVPTANVELVDPEQFIDPDILETPGGFSGNITIHANNLYVGSTLPAIADDPTMKMLEYTIPIGPFGNQQYINIGATANDGTGDPLRVAFEKINNNFSNLFFVGTNTYTTYSVGLTPSQLICSIPVNTFTQGNFQVRSSITGTIDSQDIMISAQILNSGTGVKYTGYATTFNGNAVTRYSMDVADGNVNLYADPLIDDVILHFIAAQVTYIGDTPDTLAIATQDGNQLSTENDLILATETA